MRSKENMATMNGKTTGKTTGRRHWRASLAFAMAGMLSVVSPAGTGSLNVSAEEEASAASQMSEEELIESAEEFYDQLLEYSATDEAAFVELYENTSEELIQSDMEYFAETDSQHYAHRDMYLLYDAAPYYYFVCANYTVAGTHPNNTLSYRNAQLVLKDTEEGWRIEWSDEASEAINTEEFISEMYPSGYLDAAYAGRNSAEFGTNSYLYMDDTAIYEGFYQSEAKFMWQNEDGSVDAVVWLANGTSTALYVQSISLTITDDELGTVLDQTVSCGEMINCGYSKMVTLHFDISEILTDTQAWTSMHSNVNTVYF